MFLYKTILPAICITLCSLILLRIYDKFYMEDFENKVYMRIGGLTFLSSLLVLSIVYQVSTVLEFDTSLASSESSSSTQSRGESSQKKKEPSLKKSSGSSFSVFKPSSSSSLKEKFNFREGMPTF